jgi:hypothetical protein
MSVAAAICITSPDEAPVIERASAFARLQAESCFVIAVVRQLPYDAVANADVEAVKRNLETIASARAVPVIQEGDDVAEALVAAARGFGVRRLFLKGQRLARRLRRLDPPFEVIVVGAE